MWHLTWQRWQNDKKTKILNIHIALSNEAWRVLIESFHLQNETLVNDVKNMNQKKLTGGLIRFVGNSHVYQAPKSNCFIAGRAIASHKTLFNVQIYFLWNFLETEMSGAVNPNTPHSPPVCIMFNEIAQYLKFFIFFPSVTIMTSAS